jgi:hypothetical protein
VERLKTLMAHVLEEMDQLESVIIVARADHSEDSTLAEMDEAFMESYSQFTLAFRIVSLQEEE